MAPQPWKPPTPAESIKALEASKPKPIFLQLAKSELYPPMPQPGEEDWLNGPGEKDRPGQTLGSWRCSRRRKPSARENVIYLLPLGDFEGQVDVGVLVECVAAYYCGMKVQCLEPVGNAVLKQKVKQRKCRGYGKQLLTQDIHPLIEGIQKTLPDAFIVMGFTMFDLYPREEWNFVFGQASPARGTGVFSFARYGTRSPKDFTRRCLMVLCHEIGHLFGIMHCIWWGCCMNGSNHDEESDRRPFAMCPMELAKLSEAIGKGFDLVEREKLLIACLKGAGLQDMVRWHEEHLQYILSLSQKPSRALPGLSVAASPGYSKLQALPSDLSYDRAGSRSPPLRSSTPRRAAGTTGTTATRPKTLSSALDAEKKSRSASQAR